uniref:heparan sulfate glucosamine 3-O-sulfotransferase 4-like n=1 Tax=Ciona intestinalis TaxID=7719 RepID=UPI000EF4D77C|nr:heparan sulfate glucosamine 3-O-sulfotransferase 4-like [Ciona intestinalis]|eukprot:XP_018672475.2 heparan sulfate glucosamine 3-O-sulfotransferase 4-like [Ciona intestinalis]
MGFWKYKQFTKLGALAVVCYVLCCMTQMREPCCGGGASKHDANLSITQNSVPDVIGLGIRKCGTGVFVKFLEKHGSFAIPKYINYETEYFTRNYVKGLDWYKSLFKDVASDKVKVEKTPHYYYTEPYDMAERMLKLNPNLKVFLILCEPAARAYSCFVHHNFDLFGKYEWPEFFERYVNNTLPNLQEWLQEYTYQQQETLVMERWWGRSECLIAGLYALHLKRWKAKFDDSKLLILNGDEIMRNPGPSYEKFQDFVGVERRLRQEDWVKNNETGHFCLRPPADRSQIYCLDDGIAKARTRSLLAANTPTIESLAALKAFYEPYNHMLYGILGENYGW